MNRRRLRQEPPESVPFIRVNLVTEDSVLARRVELYTGREGSLDVTVSASPVPPNSTDVYILPVEHLPEPAGEHADRLWVPTIAYGPPESLRSAFGRGCEDYLKDPWTPEELYFRTARIVRGVRFTVGDRSIEIRNDSIVTDHGAAPLSKPQSTIIRILAQYRGGVVPREVLYYLIRGRPGGASRALDMHISNLRKKLKTVAGPEYGDLIESVRGEGYRLRF